MTLTRASVEAVLIRRAGKLLTVAGLDGATKDGTNADLGDPIAFGLRQLGVTVASPSSPTDAEVGNLADDDQDQFFDMAEIRILETVLNHVLDLVNTEAGSRVDEYSQLANGIQLRLDRAELRARRLYGWTAGTLEASYAYLELAQHGEEE